MGAKGIYNVQNHNGIEVYLSHVQTKIEDNARKSQGDDEIILSIPNFYAYDTDLCINGDLVLLFSQEDALSLCRILWQMATRLMTAEQREELLTKQKGG